jgi:hypothetical protein
MDNSRREFLKKLGLGSLVVAAGVSPIIAQVVDKSIDLDIKTPEQLFNQTITIWRYKHEWGAISKAFPSKGECELDALLDITSIRNSKPNEWEQYGGITAMYLSNFAYDLACDFDVKQWDAKVVGNYLKNKLPEIFSQEITLQKYLNELQDGSAGYLAS